MTGEVIEEGPNRKAEDDLKTCLDVGDQYHRAGRYEEAREMYDCAGAIVDIPPMHGHDRSLRLARALHGVVKTDVALGRVNRDTYSAQAQAVAIYTIHLALNIPRRIETILDEQESIGLSIHDLTHWQSPLRGHLEDANE